MTNSQIFKKAHAIAKNAVKVIGNYVAAFAAALRQVYASLRKPTIKSVTVQWSESGLFKDNTTYSFKEYTALAAQAAELHGDGGYLKTKIDINYSNGVEYTMRHDIGCDPTNLNERMKEYAEYCLAEDAPDFMRPCADLRVFLLEVVA